MRTQDSCCHQQHKQHEIFVPVARRLKAVW
jgi:hypothetical protein